MFVKGFGNLDLEGTTIMATTKNKTLNNTISQNTNRNFFHMYLYNDVECRCLITKNVGRCFN